MREILGMKRIKNKIIQIKIEIEKRRNQKNRKL